MFIHLFNNPRKAFIRFKEDLFIGFVVNFSIKKIINRNNVARKFYCSTLERLNKAFPAFNICREFRQRATPGFQYSF